MLRLKIGSHPHVIEPAKVTLKERTRYTCRSYSLGNYTSAQDMDSTMAGGMQVYIELWSNTKKTSFADTKFIHRLHGLM